MKTIASKIGVIVLKYMNKNNIGLKHMANELGTSITQVHRITKGEQNISLKTICKIQSITGEKIILI